MLACALAFLVAPSQAAAYDPGVALTDFGSTVSYLTTDETTNNNVTATVELCGDLPTPPPECTGADRIVTIVDEGVSSIPDADGAGGCSVSGNTATCPLPPATKVRVNARGGNDVVDVFGDGVVDVAVDAIAHLFGGEGNDVLHGGDNFNFLNGGGGDDRLTGGPVHDLISGDTNVGTGGSDVIDGGLGPDTIDGGTGTKDTLTYENRTRPVVVNLTVAGQGYGGEGCNPRHDQDPTCNPDADFDGIPDDTDGFPGPDKEGDYPIAQIEHLIGGGADDILVGSQYTDTLDGGPAGADTLCGGLGDGDVVDYSLRDTAVQVSLDGRLPTDPKLLANDPRARENCVGRSAAEAGQFDCVANDGNATDGVAGARDCVGEDVENIRGSSHDDTLTGSDPERVQAVSVTGGGETLAGSFTLTYHGETTAPIPHGDCPSEVGGNGCATSADIDAALEALSTIGPGGASVVVYHVEGQGYAWMVLLTNSDPTTAGILTVAHSLSGGTNPSMNVTETGSPRMWPRGSNRLIGGAGDDTLDGRLGPDVFEAGAGNDTVSYAGHTEGVTATIDGAGDDGGPSDLSVVDGRRDSILGEVENVVGSQGGDTIRGDLGANSLDGGPGNDSVNGGAGNDTLLGGSGNDLLEGGSDSDVLLAEEGEDDLYGNSGADELEAGPGGTGADPEILVGGSGPDSFSGGEGIDRASYSASVVAVTVSADGARDDGTPGEGDNVSGDIEDMQGGIDNDVLLGNGGNGTLIGGAGDDTLDGGGGADVLIGGDGMDTASYENHGGVTVTLGGGSGDGAPGEGDDARTENATGGPGNDTLIGDGGTNVLTGRGGNDTLNGNGGADQLLGEAGSDSLNGNGSTDALRGGEGNDDLKGGSGNDRLDGEGGDDTLDGESGADTLNGGAGTDLASYASRTRAVEVSLDGSINDGESNENDNVRTDVESVTTGSGDDEIKSNDGAKGVIKCGGGTDRVLPDSLDDVASDCEIVTLVAATGRCTIARRAATMSRTGRIGVRITCPVRASGTLTLTTARAVRAQVDDSRRKARKLRLGRKSFRLRAGQSRTLKVKLSRKARRVVKRSRRGLRVRAALTARIGTGQARATRRSSRTITVRANRGRR